MAVETLTTTKALERVRGLHNAESVMVYIEDARLRKWFGNSGREKLQGAGSVKRDSSIWEQFCIENNIPHRLIPPKDNTTKLGALRFKDITKWKERTSEHSRDAALLVFGISGNFDYGLYR